MDVRGLICDYDGTIASHDSVSVKTREALRAFRDGGRRLILATGRILDDLHAVFDEFGLFDMIVAENGAVVCNPSTGEETVLAEPPPPRLLDALKRRRIPHSVGQVLIASSRPHETELVKVLADVGVEYRIVFNKGAIMVLPAEVSKASGIAYALHKLGLSYHNVVGVGDAENDIAFLQHCGASAAVGDAHHSLRAEVDLRLHGKNGQGVIELLDIIARDGLRGVARKDVKIHVGTRPDGRRALLSCDGCCMLAIGTSGSGKSTFAVSFIEQLLGRDYQLCVLDPEGDYELLEQVVTFGSVSQAPSRMNILHALSSAQTSVVVNMVALRPERRPAFVMELMTEFDQLRRLSGRPHWVLMDEAHQLLPGHVQELPPLANYMLVTLYPDQISPAALDCADIITGVGRESDSVIARAAELLDQPVRFPDEEVRLGEALIWERRSRDDAYKIELLPTHAEVKRHGTRYARGEISEEHSFYFTGADHRMRLRAQNLSIFLQIAEGIEDAIWSYHLRRGDYANWFRYVIRDEELAQAAERIAREHLSARESRERMRRAIEEAYTLPAVSLLTAQVARRG